MSDGAVGAWGVRGGVVEMGTESVEISTRKAVEMKMKSVETKTKSVEIKTRKAVATKTRTAVNNHNQQYILHRLYAEK